MKGMDRIRAGLNPYMTCKGFNPVYSCPIPPLLWNKRTKLKEISENSVCLREKN
jgi:hypothetical protein